jgi:HEPN domain-containing protein
MPRSQRDKSLSTHDPHEVAEALLAEARGDEAGLRVLVDHEDVPDHVAGFLAQQAIEKAIKAVLTARGTVYDRRHDLDYLIAAAAQETGAAVLHYDRDYDTLAEIMGFESVWLAPPGSLA